MKSEFVIRIGLVVAILTIFIVPVAPVAEASYVTSSSDTMSSQKISPATSSHVIKFTTPTGASESTDTIIITFPSDFNFSSKTIGQLTFTHGATTGVESTETLAASPTATVWGAVFSGTQNRILTLTAPTDGVGTANVAAGNIVIITYNSTTSVNPTTAGSYTITVSGTFGDTGSILIYIVNDDQVAVSSIVPQSMSFAVGSSSVNLGTLSTSAPAGGSHTLTIGTNAGSGMVLTVTGSTLTFGSNTISACSVLCASSAGTEQFGINLVDNSTPDVGLAATGTNPVADIASGYGTANNFKFVSGATIASSTAGINSTGFTVAYMANIAAATEAGAYTTTLTYTATATF